MQAAFILMIEVDDINLESLAADAGEIQDAAESAGFSVLYCHPYSRPSQEGPNFGPQGSNPPPDGLGS